MANYVDNLYNMFLFIYIVYTYSLRLSPTFRVAIIEKIVENFNNLLHR